MSTPQDRNLESLTQGPIVKTLFTLATPLILANLLLTSHQLINTLWVGRLGANAVAAVSSSFSILFIVITLSSGLSMAGSILVAQYAGARNFDMVNRVAAQNLLLTLAVSLTLSLAFYFAAPQLLHRVGTPREIMADALPYMRLSLLGGMFSFIQTMFQSLLRGVGEVKAPLRIAFAGVMLNLVLDPLFIFGWGPVPAGGVFGAACATLLAQALMAAIGLFLLCGNRFKVQLRLSNMAPDGKLFMRILKLGIPGSIEQSTQALGITALTAIASQFGTMAIAAYGIGFRLYSFAMLPAIGISMATSTLVGQNVGAGNYQRARQIAFSAAWRTTGFLILVSLVFCTFTTPLVRMFVPNDPALVPEAVAAVRYMSLSLGLLGVQSCIVGALRGSGDTFAAMTCAFIGIWFVQIPLALALSKYTPLGTIGLWLSYPAGSLTVATLAFVRLRSGHWQKHRLTRSTAKTPLSSANEALAEENRL